ncbi:MAG: DUF4398 domain-containing protein [Proteobacteria bacterium]|jgi:hypothetical protein|nr:DUF4398 domain-containing protein [Pseudomonadota bacterium]
MRIFHRAALISAVSSLLLLLGGCASTPPPTDAMTQARDMLEAARGAQATIFAPLDLGAAQARYALAQQALAGKHYDRARRYANEAEAAAELARARAELGQLREQIHQRARANAELSSRLLGIAPGAATQPMNAAPAPASSATQTYPANAGSTGGAP